jgi:hypothetical protein
MVENITLRFLAFSMTCQVFLISRNETACSKAYYKIKRYIYLLYKTNL